MARQIAAAGALRRRRWGERGWWKRCGKLRNRGCRRLRLGYFWPLGLFFQVAMLSAGDRGCSVLCISFPPPMCWWHRAPRVLHHGTDANIHVFFCSYHGHFVTAFGVWYLRTMPALSMPLGRS